MGNNDSKGSRGSGGSPNTSSFAKSTKTQSDAKSQSQPSKSMDMGYGYRDLIERKQKVIGKLFFLFCKNLNIMYWHCLNFSDRIHT